MYSYVPSCQQHLIIRQYSLAVATRISPNYQVLLDDGNRIIFPQGNFKFQGQEKLSIVSNTEDKFILILFCITLGILFSQRGKRGKEREQKKYKVSLRMNCFLLCFVTTIYQRNQCFNYVFMSERSKIISCDGHF